MWQPISILFFFFLRWLSTRGLGSSYKLFLHLSTTGCAPTPPLSFKCLRPPINGEAFLHFQLLFFLNAGLACFVYYSTKFYWGKNNLLFVVRDFKKKIVIPFFFSFWASHAKQLIRVETKKIKRKKNCKLGVPENTFFFLSFFCQNNGCRTWKECY